MVAPWICSTALRTRAWLVAARLAKAKTSCSEGWVSKSRQEGAALIARHLSQAREITGGHGISRDIAGDRDGETKRSATHGPDCALRLTHCVSLRSLPTSLDASAHL